MSLQFSFDRLSDDTKIPPVNVPDHETGGGCINLLKFTEHVSLNKR